MRPAAVAAALLLNAAVVAAEPRIELKIGSVRFPAGSVVQVPAGFAEPVEEDALGNIEVGTVRVHLNGTPMSAFVGVNRLPRGVRTIVRLGLSLGAEFSLRPAVENVLTFAAADESKVGYHATFYVVPDESVTAPQVAPTQKVRVEQEIVRPPAPVSKPVIVITSDIPSRTDSPNITVAAEITDMEGLRRIAIEVNGRDEDEVLLQNERPVRRRRGWTARGGEPGSVVGDGRRIVLEIPVSLRRNAINVIAVKAENQNGLIERVDHTVETSR